MSPQIDSPDWSSIGQSAVYQDASNPISLGPGGTWTHNSVAPPSARAMMVVFSDLAAISNLLIYDNVSGAELMSSSFEPMFGGIAIPISGPSTQNVSIQATLVSGLSTDMWVFFYDAPLFPMAPQVYPLKVYLSGASLEPWEPLLRWNIGLTGQGSTAHTSHTAASGESVYAESITVTLGNSVGTASTYIQFEVYDGAWLSGTLIGEIFLYGIASAGAGGSFTFPPLVAQSGELSIGVVAVGGSPNWACNSQGYDR